jgi:hypothetical protein
MANKAFILTNQRDIYLAKVCLRHFLDRGWDSYLLIDPTEWSGVSLPERSVPAGYSTNGRGMFGIPCALGISDGILRYSNPGDVVLKTDCDVWISQLLSEWFSKTTNARALKMHRKKTLQPWGGCWAATYENLQQARKYIANMDSCPCPESMLHLLGFSKSHGLNLHSMWYAWENGGSEMVSEHLVTLPIAKSINRLHDGLSMYAAQSSVSL